MKDSALEMLEDNLNDSNLTTTTKGGLNRTSNNFSINSKGEQLVGVSNQKAIKKVKLLPKNLFPQLHEKTMFKAAIEYSMGNQQTTRSLNDHNLSIEKQVLDGQAKL